MTKTTLKTRILSTFCSLVLIVVGGGVFLTSGPLGMLVGVGLVVVGFFLLIGSIRGTSSFSIGPGHHEFGEMDTEEYLAQLRGMSLKKRKKQIAAIILMRRVNLSGDHDPDDEKSAALVQGINEIIKEDLQSLSEEEKAAYMKQITPNPKAIQFMEGFKKLTSNRSD